VSFACFCVLVLRAVRQAAASLFASILYRLSPKFVRVFVARRCGSGVRPRVRHEAQTKADSPSATRCRGQAGMDIHEFKSRDRPIEAKQPAAETTTRNALTNTPRAMWVLHATRRGARFCSRSTKQEPRRPHTTAGGAARKIIVLLMIACSCRPDTCKKQ